MSMRGRYGPLYDRENAGRGYKVYDFDMLPTKRVRGHVNVSVKPLDAVEITADLTISLDRVEIEQSKEGGPSIAEQIVTEVHKHLGQWLAEQQMRRA